MTFENCIFVLELWLCNSVVLLSIRQPTTVLHCELCHQTILQHNSRVWLQFDAWLHVGVYATLSFSRLDLGDIWLDLKDIWLDLKDIWLDLKVTWLGLKITWLDFAWLWSYLAWFGRYLAWLGSYYDFERLGRYLAWLGKQLASPGWHPDWVGRRLKSVEQHVPSIINFGFS